MLLLLAPLLLDAQRPDFSWLVGHWCTAPRNGAMTCETWTPMEKGVMRGEGTNRTGDRITTNETMTITLGESGMFFNADPANQKPASFRGVKYDAAARSVTFEDAAHDYPQRVRYWREGPRLLAEISRIDGSKPSRWDFCPADAQSQIEPGCAAPVQ